MTTTETLATVTVTNAQLDLVRRTIAKDATNEELELFLYDCQRRGVHPLDKLLHFSKRGGKYTPITSIDLMRIQAADTGEMAGSDEPEFGGEDDDRWARVTVYRLTQGQRFAYVGKVWWSEYYPGDKEGFMWRKMPHGQLAKCAEAVALRKAFPKQLHGQYVPEEMAQAEREAPRTPSWGSAPRIIQEGGNTTVATAPQVRSVAKAVGLAVPPETDEAAAASEFEHEERETLIKEANRLSKVLKLADAERRAFKKEHLGDEHADIFTADVAALTAMVKDMKKREPKA